MKFWVFGMLLLTFQINAEELKESVEELKQRLILEDFDKDGDGELSTEEKEKKEEADTLMIEDLVQRQKELYDVDKDGALNKFELQAGRSLFFKNLLKTFDKNKTGKLSKSELRTAQKYYLNERKLPDFAIESPP